MKKLLTTCCFLSAIIISQNSLSQKPPSPCCTILSVGPADAIVQPDGAGPVDAIVVIRNITTGRTCMFSRAALDRNNLKVGDAINVDIATFTVTAIKGKGVGKGFSIFEPNSGTPCCSITNIKTGESCCNIVSVQNNRNNYSFSVPKEVSSNLKVGQPVNMGMKNTYAFVKMNVNGKLSCYSYPVENPSNDKSGSQAMWDMQPDPTLKGLTGEVTMQIPKEVQFNTHMEFYEAGDNNKSVASWFGNNKAKLLPGLYDILIDKKYTIKNVPVEQGKQTRLLMGVLQWSGYGSILLEDANHQKFSYGAPFKKVLPVGTYTIVGKKQKPNTFEIVDGKLTEF